MFISKLVYRSNMDQATDNLVASLQSKKTNLSPVIVVMCACFIFIVVYAYEVPFLTKHCLQPCISSKCCQIHFVSISNTVPSQYLHLSSSTHWWKVNICLLPHIDGRCPKSLTVKRLSIENEFAAQSDCSVILLMTFLQT